jgi:3-isopropylmalate/(R)-2-methylmalate dehydratase small subunit
MTSLVREGRVWKFGEQLNTDIMLPGSVIRETVAEQRKHCMEAIRPGWWKEVREGDIIIAGGGFGTGSGRPAPAVLHACGIRAVAANSVNALFLRNTVNSCVPALEHPDVAAMFEEGDVARLDFTNGKIENVTRKTSLLTKPLPPLLVSIVEKGGLIAMLAEAGFIEPQPFTARSS